MVSRFGCLGGRFTWNVPRSGNSPTWPRYSSSTESAPAPATVSFGHLPTPRFLSHRQGHQPTVPNQEQAAPNPSTPLPAPPASRSPAGILPPVPQPPSHFPHFCMTAAKTQPYENSTRSARPETLAARPRSGTPGTQPRIRRRPRKVPHPAAVSPTRATHHSGALRFRPNPLFR